jgi:hypothetical protein
VSPKKKKILMEENREQPTFGSGLKSWEFILDSTIDSRLTFTSSWNDKKKKSWYWLSSCFPEVYLRKQSYGTLHSENVKFLSILTFS